MILLNLYAPNAVAGLLKKCNSSSLGFFQHEKLNKKHAKFVINESSVKIKKNV